MYVVYDTRRMSNPLKLLSLNIERGKHYDRWIPFVQENNFDVICLQEVYKSDLGHIQSKIGGDMYFAPMANSIHDDTLEHDVIGVAMFVYVDHDSVDVKYYAGTYNATEDSIPPKQLKECPRVLLHLVCTKDGSDFHVGTTHFTWTFNGEINALQKKDLKSFLETLKQYDDMLFCGDMNAPRGRECFDTIAQIYIDHIPMHYVRSLDLDMRDKPVVPDPNLMVDALFSTQHYRTENVELVSGLSDHMGIVADVYKNKE